MIQNGCFSSSPSSPFQPGERKQKKTKRRYHLSWLNIKGSNAIMLKKTNVLGQLSSFYHNLPFDLLKVNLYPSSSSQDALCPQKKVHPNLILGLSPAQNQDFGYTQSPCLSPYVMLQDLANQKLKGFLSAPITLHIQCWSKNRKTVIKTAIQKMGNPQKSQSKTSIKSC